MGTFESQCLAALIKYDTCFYLFKKTAGKVYKIVHEYREKRFEWSCCWIHAGRYFHVEFNQIAFSNSVFNAELEKDSSKK